MNTFDAVNRQAFSIQNDRICKSCQEINNDIKALQVNHCPRYCSSLKFYMRVRYLSFALDEVYEMSDKLMSLRHSKVEFVDFGQNSPRYDCLAELHVAIINLAVEKKQSYAVKASDTG